MSSRYPHGILPPAESFPKWHNRAGGELVYFGWGRRDYNVNPIPIHTDPGWSYYLLIRGSAKLLMDGREENLDAYDGFIAGPGCPYGFAPLGVGHVEVLTWILHSAPTKLNPPMGQAMLRRLKLGEDEAERLTGLGKRTRSEIFSGDPLAPDALEAVCRLVEIEFTRVQLGNPDLDPQKVLMRTARNWILEHLDQQRPVEDMAEFLKLSPMSLHRLMVKETGMSPGRYFRTLKMERCRDLLEQSPHSVKWIAYQMGYSHANDFSRAFRAHFGLSPNEVRPNQQQEPLADSHATPAGDW